MASFIPSLRSLFCSLEASPEVLQYIMLDRIGEDIKVMVIPSGQGLDLVLPQINPGKTNNRSTRHLLFL